MSVSKLNHEHIIALLITLDTVIEESGVGEAVKTIAPKKQTGPDSFDAPAFLRAGDYEEPKEMKPVPTRKARRVELLREVQEYINGQLSKISFGLDIDSPKEQLPNATN